MKSLARAAFLALAACLLYLGFGLAASSLKTVDREDVLPYQPLTGPSTSPGVFSNFNPRNIPELQEGRAIPVVEPYLTPRVPAPPPAEFYGSHKVAFVPAREARPPEAGTSIPIVDRLPPGYTDLNEREDQRAFDSKLYTDTSFYFNKVDGSKRLSSVNQESFYEQNLRYDLFTTKSNGDSLALIVDTTHTNDPREYKEGFTLNQFSLESRTPRSQLVFGHSYPEFTNFTMTQQVMGLYGVQRFSNAEIRSYTGYKAVEKDDLKNPRLVSGFRLEHKRDEAVTIGINGVDSRDVHQNPGSNQDLPTIKNQVYSMDVNVHPTENIVVTGEYAGSSTDFDRRHGAGKESAEAFKGTAAYGRENYRVEAGVEAADTPFYTASGESLRDEKAFFGHMYYEVNRYFSTRIAGRTGRDNLAAYKRATLVRDEPEVQVTIRPSDYYHDMRVDFFYQPLHEYSDGTDFVNRYRDLAWLEFNHRAGAFRYFGGLSSTIDKDKVTPSNDKDIGKLDLKLTWEYDMTRQLYAIMSMEQLDYETVGGQDKTTIYGFGGRSDFHEDLTFHLDFTHENSDPTATLLDSSHDRVNLSLTKEYNNMSRLILSLEGSNHHFANNGRDYTDYSARVRFLRSF